MSARLPTQQVGALDELEDAQTVLMTGSQDAWMIEDLEARFAALNDSAAAIDGLDATDPRGFHGDLKNGDLQDGAPAEPQDADELGAHSGCAQVDYQLVDVRNEDTFPPLNDHAPDDRVGIRAPVAGSAPSHERYRTALMWIIGACIATWTLMVGATVSLLATL